MSPALAANAADPLPQVATGTVERMASFPSRHVNARHVDVWLPDGYGKDPARRYQVLYMQDGAMLFDPATTWNKQAWRADATLGRLIREGKVPDTMIVGIWNGGPLRHSEYMPQRFMAFVPEPLRTEFIAKGLGGKPRADAYLRFLVEELKPAIDARYATLPDRAHTFVMGSSMGGMISIYAMNEYPAVFGGAAGLSTHWVGSHQPNATLPLAAFRYLSSQLADPATHRLYMDHGTTELDALYAPYQVFVDQIARDRGYSDANFSSRVFEGAGHNENDWAQRLAIPMQFLLGNKP